MLATIREWRNSLVPINRVPLDILSLIPTYLTFPHDGIFISSVCRHWRRIFIQHTALWTCLCLTRPRTDLYMKTLLERSKGSALDIIVYQGPTSANPLRAETLALLSPHAQRIGSLSFIRNCWADIQKLSEVAAGPLPLLWTLKIRVVYGSSIFSPTVMTPPLLPPFADVVNLREFHLDSEGLPFLDHFIFPNLTTLELIAMPVEGFPGSQLLNFLEASPTLQTVHITIKADVLLGDVSPGRVVILPNVEMFNLLIGEGGPGCKVAAHISCPSAKLTSLRYEQYADNTISPEIFPTSVSWNAITRQCSASQVDEIALWIMATDDEPIIACFLAFLSPGPAVLSLGFEVTARDDDDEVYVLGGWHAEIFSQASKAIRTHPLLPNVKRLRIQDQYITIDSDRLTKIASEVGQLFKSMDPLDVLTLDIFDLRPYLAPFLDLPEFRDMDQPGGFPSIKELTIMQPSQAPAKQECMAAVVELAKSKHALGVPLERVTIHMRDHPPKMAEWLNPWVGVVDCHGEMGDDR